MKRLMLIAIGLVFLSQSLVAQTEPAVEMRSLLTTRMLPNGNMMLSEFRVFFPPAEPAKGTLSLHQGKQQIFSRPLAPRYRNLDEQKVFARVDVQGIPVQKLDQAGNYELRVTMNEKLVSRFPFSVEIKKSGDAFNPSSSYVFKGPWLKLAYLKSYPHTDKETRAKLEGMTVAFSSAHSDVPKDEKNDVYLHAFLRMDAETVAHSKLSVGKRVKVHPNLAFFESVEHDLYQPHEKKDAGIAKRFTFENLKDGSYTLSIERSTDQSKLRSFGFKVADGKIQEHARAALDYKPHADMLAPRAMKTGTTTDEHQVIHWLVANPDGEDAQKE